MGTVDVLVVVVVVVVALVHLISWAAVRPGPSNFERMGRGPARPINFSEDGPWPGPAHQFFRGWAAARPGPSIFQRMGSGPAQPITFSKIQGPAHHFFKRLGQARPGPSHGGEAHETRALYRPARQLGGPTRGFDGPAHVLFRTKTFMYTLR